MQWLCGALALVLVVRLDFLPCIKKKNRREAAAYAALLGAACLLFALYALGVPLPELFRFGTPG